MTPDIKDEHTNTHDGFWQHVADTAAERVRNLFEKSGIDVKEAIGGDGEIKSFIDAKKTLAYVMCHADTDYEKACAILSISEWLHACNELHEHHFK